MSDTANRRILLVDDMPSIHEDFRKILAGSSETDLDRVEAALFGDVATTVRFPGFELDSAYQGSEALIKVETALQLGLPYAIAFVDMRMPPGWDGVETIERLWQKDARIQVVICTAYADHSWSEMLSRLKVNDRLLILKKPFDNIEVLQLANALTAKWDMTQQAALQMNQLEIAVQARTHQIQIINNALQTEMIERKQLENQLVQSEKLASIGQLAAGVAHEINNPIGYVFANFGTLEKYLDGLLKMLTAYENAECSITAPQVVADLHSLREGIDLTYLKADLPALMSESKEGLSRVRKIVQDLKDFARVDSNQEWQWVQLHAGIDSTLNIIAHDIKYTADVVKEYGIIPDIECLPSQLNQVVMNLVLNAAQAMGPKRGQITIRTGCETAQVWIEVADTGCGICPEVLPRIFDPFFTTKPVGTGTGLGLSLSYGIVCKHNGRIEVTSEMDCGTTFRVILPIKHVAPAA